ncbi:MAG: class I SAM-dependent methyltransferase [Deltaproteobacteria bacterium]|nr:MAG: class I SAM-dependent methyltransferase [Deltaproteobacteria bacterium]
MRWVFRELRDWWRGQREPESRAFDAQYGTRTVWFDLFNYEPSLPSVIEASLDALDIDVEDYTFVDLGSGKGRVVLLAAMRPFHEVVGIEYRERLHGLALDNLASFRGDLAAPVRFECADAARARLPDGPLVLYLFNPFPAEVLVGILAKIQDSARLVYVNPVAGEVLDELGWEEIARHEDEDVVRSWRIYAGPYD